GRTATSRFPTPSPRPNRGDSRPGLLRGWSGRWRHCPPTGGELSPSRSAPGWRFARTPPRWGSARTPLPAATPTPRTDCEMPSGRAPMSDSELPPDLAALERQLAERPRIEPSPDFGARLLAASRAALGHRPPAVGAAGWRRWAAVAAAVLFGINLSMSVA